MKVAMVSTAKAACGIATYSEYLGTALRDLGHEVTVFGEHTMENLPYKLPVVDSWNRWDYQSYRKLREALTDWKPDVVHWQYEWSLHGPYGYRWDGPLYAMSAPMNNVFTWHNVIPDQKSVCYGRCAERHIVHNQPCRDALARMPFPASIIPHGTRKNAPIPVDKAKEKLGIPANKKVVGVFGFVVPRKGYHLILNSWKQIKRTCPDAFFLIIGGKHPKGAISWAYYDLFERAQKLFPEDLKLTGYVENDTLIDEYLSAVDMLAFTHIGDENLLSASGSIRRTIDHGILTAVQDIPFYAGLDDRMVLKIPRDLTVPTFGRWIGRQLEQVDSPQSVERKEFLKAHAKQTYWSEVAKEHLKVYGN